MILSQIAELASQQLTAFIEGGKTQEKNTAHTENSEHKKDFEQQRQLFKTQLETLLRKAGLVTQDEFEIQQAVLAKTREKIEQLEKIVADLETQQKQ